jgi:hypothetical protein
LPQQTPSAAADRSVEDGRRAGLAAARQVELETPSGFDHELELHARMQCAFDLQRSRLAEGVCCGRGGSQRLEVELETGACG